MSAKSNVRLPLVTLALVGIGIGLLVYVGAEYGQMWTNQHRLFRALRVQAAHPDVTSGPNLTRLQIPRIELDAMVVEGTTRGALLVGPGHLENSPFPGDGGNFVIAGHRDTFFRRLHELCVGDKILVQRNGHQYNYYVTSKTIVAPDNISVLKSDAEVRLTLITCYPTHYIGPAPRRLVIEARLVSS